MKLFVAGPDSEHFESKTSLSGPESKHRLCNDAESWQVAVMYCQVVHRQCELRLLLPIPPS